MEPQNAIYDARQLGTPRMMVLGVQHLFALILVLAIGVKYGANDDIALGPIHLSGLAIAAIVGIFLNAIMPTKLGMKVKSFKGKEK